MENSTDHADNNPHPKYDTQELIRDHPFPRTNTLEESETTTHATLYPPSSSQSRDGYEDMTRLKRTWTKPEAAVDQKGYVLINPVKRPSSPASSPVNPPTSLKPLSISSMTYENFIPLKTRHFEVRRLPQSVPDEGAKSAGEPSPPKSGESKPEKPGRHNYENFEISGQHANESKEIQQDTRDNSSEKSTSTALPVLRVPPVPQVPPDPPSGVSNSKSPEYDQLYDWLAQSKLLAYFDNFATAGFDLSAMADLTGEDLSEILVTKTGHRKRLLSEAAKLSKPVFTYENNVPSWLKSIGLSLYENHFIEGGFDDLEFLSDLTKEDLEAIGITKIGHQRKLLMAAKKLQQRGTAVWKPVV